MIGLNKSLEQDSKILFEIITEVTGITQEQINNGSRKRNITDARMMMCESLRRNSKYTLREIGSIAGGLDHSSIVYYRTKLVDICDVDREFKKKFTEINLRFKQIKISGLPLSIRLSAAIEERDRLNKEIRIMKKKLSI
jgi:chromosomal replication initiation ATPase DnaA